MAQLTQWRYGQTFDPFTKKIPAPSAGIFDNTNGLRTVCFNPEWSNVILGALSRLELSDLYLSGGDSAVQEVFKFNNVVAGIGDNPCLPQSVEETNCNYYPSWYAGIEYIPHNPFDNFSEFDPQYPVAPFFRFGRIDTIFPSWIDEFFLGVAEWATGYRENDIFVSYLSLPTATNPFDGLDYPTIKLTVQGSGTVKLKLLNVPFGGRALISLDSPDISDLFNSVFSPDDAIIELNRDILSIPPETDLDSIEEIHLETDDTHEIYITFLPVINDEIPIIQMGGGFRGYELCGNLTVVSPITGLPIDFTNENEDIYQEGFTMGTYEDFLSALDAHERRRSSRYLLGSDASNIQNGITLDAHSATSDGVTIDSGVTIKSGSSGTSAPNVSATADEILYGGALGVGRGFRDLIGDIILRRIDQSRTAESVADLLRGFFFLRGLVDSVDLLALALGTPLSNATDTVTPVVNPQSVANRVYCGSDIRQSLKRYALDIEDANGTDAVHIAEFYRAVIDELEDEQLQAWFEAGRNIPSSGYTSAPCYRQPNQLINFTVQDFIDNANAKAWINQPKSSGTVFRFEISGQVSDGSGNVWDGVFLKTTNDVITQETRGFLFLGSSTWASSAPALTYNPNGGYSFEVEIPSNRNLTYFDSHPLGGGTPVDFMRSANSLSGGLTLTVIDLGAL